MTSIHDSFDLIKKLAAYRTSEEIDAIEDEWIREEVREEDMQGIRDALDRVIFQARALVAEQQHDKLITRAPSERKSMNEEEAPVIEYAIGLPVHITVEGDGALGISVDLSEAMDIDFGSSAYLGDREVEEYTGEALERLRAALGRAGHEATISFPAPAGGAR